MIETARLLLIPVDIEILDSLIDSDESFLNIYGYINDGGESVYDHDAFLLEWIQRFRMSPALADDN